MNGKLSIRKAEFEARILVSLGIVLVICLLSVLFAPSAPSLVTIMGKEYGADPTSTRAAAFIAGAVLMLLCSLLRMWAGTMLSARRVMSFRIKADALKMAGPYRFCRNPIYLADLIAVATFALYLPPIGLLMPALFLLHYGQLIRYEEAVIGDRHGVAYRRYLQTAPRLFPTPASLRSLPEAFREWTVTAEGFRHNALYVLFIPGLILAAWMDSFLVAVVAGLPAVIDWAVVHTRLGLSKSADDGNGNLATATGNVADALAPATKEKSVFRSVLYAQCWEDPEIDRIAFNIRTGDSVFTITSGGDNALAFLIDDPARVIAVDLNRHQNDMLELKLACLRALSRDEMLAFAGVAGCDDRLRFYARIRPFLSPDATAYWDAHLRDIRGGFIHAGRFEGYMRIIRRSLRLLLGRRALERLFSARDAAERREIMRVLDRRRWRVAMRLLLSRRVLSLLFDPAFFAFIEHDFSFGAHFSELARRAFTDLPVYRSCFLSYILLGNFRGEALPLWMRREHWDCVRERAGRIEIATANCGDYFAALEPDGIDAFNFTNIFEWMPEAAYHSLLEETVRVGRDGATITYRNLLVPRSRPASHSATLTPDRALAARLLSEDLSFIYRNYVVERISKTRKPWQSVSKRSARVAI